MRHPLFGIVLAAAVCVLAPSAGWAQVGTTIGNIGNDPFSSYYNWYLPNQAYMASQPRVEDTINAITVVRQRQAIAARDNPYDTRSPFDVDEEGDFGRYAPRPGRARAQGAVSSSPFGGNLRGNGPPLYYNRTGRYFPGLRTGHGPNRNLARLRSPRGGGGGMGGMGGMGMGMGMGMPGPR